MSIRLLKLTLLLLSVCLALRVTLSVRAQRDSLAGNNTVVTYPTVPLPGTFAPSNARTEDGKLIPAEQFFSAERCQKCHQDTHAMWSQSLHRNAAREPFYRESADILLRQRGIEFTRHCESCHTPVALFSGALDKAAARQAAPFTSLDHEGVTCSVCHSITEARLDGTGSYTIRRPALLAREDGSPVYSPDNQPITDEQILADIPGHKRAVMRPVLRSPEFCATCHKVDAPPALNGYKHIRGFSAYDEWQQSGASHEAVQPYYYRAERADCRTCHMPKVVSLNDRAAKLKDSGQPSAISGQQDRQTGRKAGEETEKAEDRAMKAPETDATRRSNDAAKAGNRQLTTPHSSSITENRQLLTVPRYIASHRWLGASTAAPLFYGQMQQVRATIDFLKANVAEVDLFALRRSQTNELIAPLNRAAHTLFLQPGEDLIAEVIISNRNAAHSFPPEVRDLYEAWVEFEAIDAKGRTLFHSGAVRPDGMLDESAHVYKQLILDEQGRAITRHQIWTTNIKAYDNTIGAGRSDVVRYRFRVPEAQSATGSRQRSVSRFSPARMPNAEGRTPETAVVTLRARLNYRRLNQEYTNYVLKRQKRELTLPVVEMAAAEVKLLMDQSGKSSQAEKETAVRAHSKLQTPNSELQTPNSKLRTPNSGSFSDNRQPITEARRWNDYGIGLMEQAQYGAASEAFRNAATLSPGDPQLLINAAVAEYRTERFGLEREQVAKARELLQRALTLISSPMATPNAEARAKFWLAQVLRSEGKREEAAQMLAEIAEAYPRDREVRRQLGQTLYTLGRYELARATFLTLLGIDPTDANAWQLLAPLSAGLGMKEDAARAQEKYLLWREDPKAEGIAARFYAAHPEWAEVRRGAHIYGSEAPRRPVLTGAMAGPEK